MIVIQLLYPESSFSGLLAFKYNMMEDIGNWSRSQNTQMTDQQDVRVASDSPALIAIQFWFSSPNFDPGLN